MDLLKKTAWINFIQTLASGQIIIYLHCCSSVGCKHLNMGTNLCNKMLFLPFSNCVEVAFLRAFNSFNRMSEIWSQFKSKLDPLPGNISSKSRSTCVEREKSFKFNKIMYQIRLYVDVREVNFFKSSNESLTYLLEAAECKSTTFNKTVSSYWK